MVLLRADKEKIMEIKFLNGEVWYPAVSAYGTEMPYTENYVGKVQLKSNPTFNQMTPLLLSNKGRLIYRAEGFNADFNKGSIEVDEDAKLTEGLGNIREAYKYAVNSYFYNDEICISEKFIEAPVYNTWMYSPFDITEEKTITYAKEILNASLPTGTIMIDDKWSKEYGSWVFDEKKFPDPIGMIKTLHNLGFSLMVWVCPYISFGTEEYEYCKEKDFLLMDGNEVYGLKWWNETSACFDLRKEEVLNYMRDIFKNLIDMGVDGFKMDGGDSIYYLEEHEPDKQSFLWAKLASEYLFNEIRVDFDTAGMSIFERLCDKKHEWGKKGIAALVPDTLALGLSGHPFTSPDMIGGGEVNDIKDGCELKKDIFLAHAGIATLFPSMQFSVLPTKVLGKDMKHLLSLLEIRKKYLPYLRELFRECSLSKEPFVRLLEYVFPNEGFEEVTDMFMLGDRYLVVPKTQKDEKIKKIRLPKGSWIYNENEFKNEIEIVFKPDKLPVLRRLG